MNHTFPKEHPMEQKFQQDKANREDAEKWRESQRDCRLCTHLRSLALFKGEFYCGSVIKCVNGNRFVSVTKEPLHLWKRSPF